MGHIRGINTKAIIFSFFVLFLYVGEVYAPKPAPPIRENVLEAAIQIAKDEKLDAKLREEAIRFLQETIERENEMLEERTKVYSWSRIESIVIFALAHLLVILALGAAVYEFLAARSLRKKTINAEKQEFELSMEKLAVKTSSVALLYLLLTLGFYFLYVKFVYPVVSSGQIP